MGGGGNDVEKPKAPEPPKASSSIEDYIENQPKLFELQQEQAPQEAQLQLDLLQDFGPQFGQTAKFMQEQLNPETSAIQEELAAIARSRSKGGLSDLERDQFTSDFSGQLGTNAGSPIGALASSRALMLANQGRQREGENLGLSLAGRQQLAQGQAPNVNNISGSLTPGQVLGFDQGNFGTQANIFGSQSGMFNQGQASATAERGQNMSMISNLGGSFMGMLSTREAKENIVPNTIDSIEVIKQLEIVEFDYKEEDNKHHVGIIVEDSPEILVTEDKKHLDMVNMIGVLFDVNKKLLERVEALEGGK